MVPAWRKIQILRFGTLAMAFGNLVCGSLMSLMNEHRTAAKTPRYFWLQLLNKAEHKCGGGKIIPPLPKPSEFSVETVK